MGTVNTESFAMIPSRYQVTFQPTESVEEEHQPEVIVMLLLYILYVDMCSNILHVHDPYGYCREMHCTVYVQCTCI